MTLILSHANRAGFCQVSDRFNSIGDSVARRNSNKALIVMALDGVVTIGLTGHALYQGEEVDHVLADVITNGERHRQLSEFRRPPAEPLVKSIHTTQGRIIRFLKEVIRDERQRPTGQRFSLQVCCVGFRYFRSNLIPHLTVIELIGDRLTVFGSRPLPLLLKSSFIWHLSGGYANAQIDLAHKLLQDLHTWEQRSLDYGQDEVLMSSLEQFSSRYPNSIGPSGLSVLGKIASREICVEFHDSENRHEQDPLAEIVGTDVPRYSPWIISPFGAHPPQRWLGIPLNHVIGNWSIVFSGDPNAKAHFNLGYKDRK